MSTMRLKFPKDCIIFSGTLIHKVVNYPSWGLRSKFRLGRRTELPLNPHAMLCLRKLGKAVEIEKKSVSGII